MWLLVFVILCVSRRKNKLCIEEYLCRGARDAELEQHGVPTLFIPHTQWGVERLAKVEGGAKVLAENGEGEGMRLGIRVAVKLFGSEGHLRAEDDVCRVGDIVDE